MRLRFLVGALVAASLAVPLPASGASPWHGPATEAVSVAAPADITRSDFLTADQIRSRLDLASPLTGYELYPEERNPEPDPDCASDVPGATGAKVYPVRRSRFQSFDYDVPGADWYLSGTVWVLEYSTAARARAAFRRVVASVKAATRYSIVCELINPMVTGQTATTPLAVPGTSFAWRSHLRAARAGSWREVVSTRGNRLVWVALGREFRAHLDWENGTPPAVFPRYPSQAYLERLAQGAIARGL